MADTFKYEKVGLEAPCVSAFAITPHDTNDLAITTRGLYVGGTGDVKVDMADTGTAVVFTAMAAGVIHPIRVTRVYNTDTDATAIVGVY